MSSYLNSLPPPPPPPRAGGPSSPPLVSSSSAAPPPARRPAHKHTQSTHWNDLTIDLSQRPSRTTPGQKRERVTSRVVAPPPGLSSVPEQQQGRRVSVSSTTGPPLPSPPQATAGGVLPGVAILPAFNAPPPPPPEPVLSKRYGPRRLLADVLHFPPLIGAAQSQQQKKEEKGTKLVLVFFPGNPGLVEYYTAFLSSLRNALPSPLRESTEMYAVGHLGHSTEGAGGGKGFSPGDQASLEEQVEDKVRFLDELKSVNGLGGEGGARCVVLGHSIGAWVGLQVLKLRPHLLTGLHLLFPTLSHMSKTPNGRSLSPLFSSWSLRPVFYSVGALSYLPTALTSRLVGLITGQTGPGAGVTTSLVSSPSAVLAALTLAREELATVTALDSQAVEEHAKKLWVYYAAEGVDGWVTEEGVREVEEAVERALGREEREKRVRRCREGMPHAFVLDEAHSASLARKSATWIAEDLATQDAAPSFNSSAPPPPLAPASSSSTAVPPSPPPPASASTAA
ncbi:hypothetical protein JCM8547_006998 [Rhodosporidiobolus lusitaniae]